ncbi:MAG: hypothetical protein PHX27_04620, partial [Candidatus ainarchaeum sp.]|nr:hypothetical protein [Candidatus ainarchaeum sp.]
LDKIDPNTYEKLPKIVVKDMLTNEETKIGLLPKTNLKIYIPLRFFKAIHHAKDNLEAIKYNEYDFTRARMGFCDDGCNPRKDPVTANPGDRTDASCDAEQNATRYINVNSYYPMGSGMPGSNLLQAFVSEKVCSSFNQTNSFPAMFDNYNTNLLSGNSAISTRPGCPYYSIQATLWGTDVARITGGAADQYLSCTTITSVYADVVFKETNPIYIVRGEEILYKLRLLSNPLSAQTSDHINYECKTSLSPEICEKV